MERKRRISAPFLRTGLNNYRQSKTAAQPENTIIALIQAGIADNIFSPITFRFSVPMSHCYSPRFNLSTTLSLLIDLLRKQGMKIPINNKMIDISITG